MAGLLGTGAAALEFPRERIIEMMAQRKAAELISSYELTPPASSLDDDSSIDDLVGALPGYHHDQRFVAEMNHQFELMAQAYNSDARHYQRIVGELAGGTLTQLLEEGRGSHREFFAARLEQVRTNAERILSRSVQQYGIQHTIGRVVHMKTLVSEPHQAARDEQQTLSTAIETQQSAGQQSLARINELIRRYHWLPAYLLSANLFIRVPIFLGLVIVGFVLGSFFPITLMLATVVLSAIPGTWLMFMRRLPPPETIEPLLSRYYHDVGLRIYLEEEANFWAQTITALEERETKLQSIIEELRIAHSGFGQQWQSIRAALFNPQRHVRYLLTETELEAWYSDYAAGDRPTALEAFWKKCLEGNGAVAVQVLVKRMIDDSRSLLLWTAEQRLWDIYGDKAASILFGHEAAIMNQVFTLAVRTSRLVRHALYHRTYIIALHEPEQSKLAVTLRQQLKQYGLGVKFVENGDPHRISILGAEGGFTFGSLREASEIESHFRKLKDNPMIYPRIGRITKR